MPYLARYVGQINAIRTHFKSVKVVVCEGNSVDGTKDALDGLDYKVITHDTGTPYFASNENPTRWRILTESWNTALQAVPPCDVVIALESELHWIPAVLLECVAWLDTYDVIAPMMYMQRAPDRFYDTNGFRRLGQKFSNTPPVIPGWDGQRFVDCETVGGMIAMRYPLAMQAQWRGTCRLFFPDGTRVVADTQHKVFHP